MKTKAHGDEEEEEKTSFIRYLHADAEDAVTRYSRLDQNDENKAGALGACVE